MCATIGSDALMYSGVKILTEFTEHTAFYTAKASFLTESHDLSSKSSAISFVISRPYTVVLGSDSLSGNEPTKQEFRSIRFFPHPDYDGHLNDIMLIKVLNSFSKKTS